MGYVSFREGSSKTPSDFLCLTLLKIKLQWEMTGPKPGCFCCLKIVRLDCLEVIQKNFIEVSFQKEEVALIGNRTSYILEIVLPQRYPDFPLITGFKIMPSQIQQWHPDPWSVHACGVRSPRLVLLVISVILFQPFHDDMCFRKGTLYFNKKITGWTCMKRRTSKIHWRDGLVLLCPMTQLYLSSERKPYSLEYTRGLYSLPCLVVGSVFPSVMQIPTIQPLLGCPRKLVNG